MKRALAIVGAASVVTACAASKSRDAQAPSAPQEAAPATGGAAAQSYGQPAAQEPAQQPGYPPPAPPPPSTTPAATTPATPGAAGAAPVSREVAMNQANDEIVRAERELEVSRGDCVNVCRALGSMDRATGKLCRLTADAERDRCDDAKRRLIGARDRVRSTCGSCPDGQPAVERSAPIPSMR